MIERDVLPKALADVAARREASSGTCGACLLPVEDDAKVGILDNCSHVFHFECAEQWSRTENTCPQCKVRFFWLASYRPSGTRASLTKVEKRDQEGESDEAFEDAQICEMCKEIGDEGALLLCDGMHGTCNAAFHFGCVGLSAVPREAWFCPDCAERGFDIDSSGRRGKASRDAAPQEAQEAQELAGTAQQAASSALALEASGSAAGADSTTTSASWAETWSQLPSRAALGASGSAPAASAGVASAGMPRAATSDHADSSSIAGGGGRGGSTTLRSQVPAHLRLNPLTCVSPPMEVPILRPAGGGGPSLFANFVQRRRAQRGAAAAPAAGGSGADAAAGFIKLNPTYEEDFMGGKSSA